MLEQAQKHGRDILEDILRLISTYYTLGYGSIDQTIEEWTRSDDYKQDLIAMRDIYGLRNSPNKEQFLKSLPSLSKISEGFPQVSLVLADMIGIRLAHSRLCFGVRNEELGANVDIHFKMNYFPALIFVKGFGLKAQVGLLLFNLCNTKTILKKCEEQSTVPAFTKSCKTSSYLMKQQLAPFICKKKFTKFIKSLTMDAYMLFQVWKNVIGSNRVPLSEETMITHFHKRVLKAQPLDLHKWTQLLSEEDSKN